MHLYMNHGLSRQRCVTLIIVPVVTAVLWQRSAAATDCDPEWDTTISELGVPWGFAGPQSLVNSELIVNGIPTGEQFGSVPALYAGDSGVLRWNGPSKEWMFIGGAFVVTALAVFDDGSGPALFAGGDFGEVRKWDGNHWTSLGNFNSCTYDDGVEIWDCLEGYVGALAVFDDGAGPALYAAGQFNMWGAKDSGVPMNGIARWQPDTETWSALGSGIRGGTVTALAVYDDGTGSALYAGGSFTQAGGMAVNRIAKWDPVTENWSSLGQGMDDWVFTLAVFDVGAGGGPALYAGGRFTTAGGIMANRIAKWNGTSWSSLGNGTNDSVRALAVFDDGSGGGPALYAGGPFTTAGGIMANRIAKWTGLQWASLGEGVDGGVSTRINALAVFDYSTGPGLYASGQFETAGELPALGIAKWSCPDPPVLWVGGNGIYNNSLNWQPQFVPGINAEAAFDGTVVALPPSYQVTLTDDAALRRMSVLADNVSLNLFGNSVVLHQPADIASPSLIVGTYPDVDARLLVRNTQFLPQSFAATTISIGDVAESIGRLTFRDPSVIGEAHGDLFIGRRGSGMFLAEQHATAHYGLTGSKVVIGDEPGSSGELRLLSGGRLFSMAEIDHVTFARLPESSGTALLDGGGLWTSAAVQCIVGGFGHATLSIQNGGSLFTQSPAGVVLAKEAGSVANVLITGQGSKWIESTGPIFVGNGEASLTVADGGVLDAPNFFNLLSGTVLGNGTITTGMLFNVGSVKPGSGGSPGTLTINGSYRQIGPPPGGGLDESGSLRVGIGSGGASSLHVTGTAELGGGLFVDLAPDADPSLGQSFQALTAGSIDPQFDRFDVAFMPGLTDGRFMRVCYGPACGAAAGSGGVTITVEELSVLLGFGDPESFDLEGLPTDIAVGNLIGADGLDIAVTLRGASVNDPGEVVVLHNVNGDGTVFAPTFYSIGRDPSAVVVGDFNDNGLLDLAVANRQDNEIQILLNDGAGGYVTGAPIAAGVAPSGLAVADTRNIGVLDLAVASYGDNTVRILENDGNGGFNQVSSITVGNGPRGITAASLISGLTDLAVTNFDDGTVSLLQNDGSGGYSQIAALPSGQGAWSISPADLDDDKDIDLIVSNTLDGTVSVMLNNDDGTFAPAVSLPVGMQTGPITAWDVNGDGAFPDLAVVTEDAELGRIVRVLRNDTEQGGQLTFALADALGENELPVLVARGDVTGNELEDLITINAATTIQGGNHGGGQSGSGRAGTGGIVESSVIVRPNLTGDVRPGITGDLNGDGVVNVSDLLILLSQWGPCPRGQTCAADLNDDGVVNVSDLLILLANWG